jgi:hypothetical protein
VSELIDWYRARWEVEMLFNVLKNGCCVEELQSGTIERIVRALALRAAPGIRTVAPFGATLHERTSEAEAMAATMAQPALAGLAFDPIATSLEDVFIAMMQDAQDNFEGAFPT